MSSCTGLRDRPDDLGAFVLKALLERAKVSPEEQVKEIYMGCAKPSRGGRTGTVGRRVVLPGLPVEVAGYR